MTVSSKVISEKSDFTNFNLNMPTTSAQQAIWLGQQIDKASPAYNVASYIEIRGEFKYTFLVQALCIVINETESLRAFYLNDNNEIDYLRQIINKTVDIDMPLINLQGDNQAVDTAHKLMLEELSKPISLEVGPLFTTLFIALTEQHYYWFFKTHHIAMDGYAISIFFNEFLKSIRN